MTRSLAIAYAIDTAILLALVAGLFAIVGQPPAPMPSAQSLIQPTSVLVALTAFVWLLMLVSRNTAVIRGMATLRYFETYTSEAPAEWIERPARTFMNLLEVPVLFYVAVLLMLQTQRFDQAQVALAWLFVATRIAHAVIYIGLNYVPLRFVAHVSGCITLGVLWTRFATQFW